MFQCKEYVDVAQNKLVRGAEPHQHVALCVLVYVVMCMSKKLSVFAPVGTTYIYG